MIKVVASVDIERPVHEVFSFITDLETLPIWLEGVKEARSLSPDPTALGARVAHVNEFMGQTFETTFETVEWDQGRCAVFKVLSGPIRGESRQVFDEVPSGGTRVSIQVTGDGTGFLKLGNFIAKRAAQRQLDRSLENAKRVLENGDAAKS
jgi:uncharacterized membrane protein